MPAASFVFAIIICIHRILFVLSLEATQPAIKTEEVPSSYDPASLEADADEDDAVALRKGGGHPFRLFPDPYRPNNERLSQDSVALVKVLSKKIASRKKCSLVTVAFDFDSRPEDISLMITLGNVDVVQSGRAIVMAHSHMQYKFLEKERHTLCLPEGARYTYTIFDWSGDGMKNGSYSLIAEDGQMILQGTDFVWMKRHTFTLPLAPLPDSPSMSPSISSKPTSSSSPTFDCAFIDISITYDMYPEETKWVVITGVDQSLDSGDYEVVAESPEIVDSTLAALSTEVHRVCLPLSMGDVFSFVIIDALSNGLCCLFGEGRYEITSPDLPGEIIGRGGEFSNVDVVTFRLPLQIAPSSSPSLSPQPTASSSPTTTCVPIEIGITFDSFPSDTSWYLIAASGDELYLESPAYGEELAGSNISEELCLPPDDMFTFTILDGSGDGLCCWFGQGKYSIVATGDGDGRLIFQGAVFEYSESTTFSTQSGRVVLPSDLPKPDCFPVEVMLTFGGSPYDTKWAIVEGDSLQDEDATIVIESPAYDFSHTNSKTSQIVCLEEGQYTFVCDGGDDLVGYTIRENGSVLVDGDAPATVRRAVFSVSYFSPLISSSPKIMRPKNDVCLELTIDFDEAPHELSWAICLGASDDCLDSSEGHGSILAMSPHYGSSHKNADKKHKICLQQNVAGQRYTFAISDRGADGLCCEYGNYGHYVLTMQADDGGKVVLSSGSDFGLKKSVTFESVVSPQHLSFEQAVQSPKSSSISAPTSSSCKDSINVTLNFDVFPYEIKWWLMSGDLDSLEANQHTFVATSPNYAQVDRFSNVTQEVCLPDVSNQRYTFLIFDDASNGLSGDYGDGSFHLSHKDGTIFAKGGEFGFFDVRVFDTPFPPNNGPTAPTPICNDHNMLKIVIESDEPSNDEILWEVTMGRYSSMEDIHAIIVAQSHDTESKTIDFVSGRPISHVCLKDGEYTFSLFDETSRYQLMINGKVIESSSSSSSTFRIPFVSDESFKPATSLIPSPQPTDLMNRPPTIKGDKECISVDIVFDSFPEETYWLLVSGDYNNFESGGDYIIYAEYSYYDISEYSSSSGTNSSSNASHQVCLPGEDGQYSFIMCDTDGLCCSFGEGSYILSSLDTPDLIIGKGGVFTDFDVVTFDVPLVFAPSMSPSTSPRPTESFAPTSECFVITISITFDSFPSETVWNLNDESGNTIASSPYYESSSANHTICVGQGTYEFTILDTTGDGICCLYGNGEYSVVAGAYGKVIAQGGSFGLSQKTTFDLPFQSSPTASPTSSPAPSVSYAPTPACIWIKIVLNFDANPLDTMWEVSLGDRNTLDFTDDDFNDVDENDSVIVASSPLYDKPGYVFGTVSHAVCLPGRQQYTFSILDGRGDGMCCSDYQGTGDYMILLLVGDKAEIIVASDGDFGWTESKTFDLSEYVQPVSPRINFQDEDV